MRVEAWGRARAPLRTLAAGPDAGLQAAQLRVRWLRCSPCCGPPLPCCRPSQALHHSRLAEAPAHALRSPTASKAAAPTLFSRRVMRSLQAGEMAGCSGKASGFFSTFSKVASRRAPLQGWA